MAAFSPVDLGDGRAAGARDPRATGQENPAANRNGKRGAKSGKSGRSRHGAAARPSDGTAAESSRRICVLVLGMHRSGTSALTRVISLLGAALPKKILGEGPGNEPGHWEPARLVDLHDEMLAAVGSSWDDFRAFDPADLPDARRVHYRAEITRILREDYGDQPLIVLKEPRICRFAPLYIEILQDLGYEVAFVHMTRNPLAVAASLERRDGISPSYGRLMWLRHVLDAEAATRGRRRSFVSYEGLLSDWRPARDRIKAALGIDFREQAETSGSIDSFLSGRFTHHQSDPAALMRDDLAPAWLKDVYDALSALEANAEDAPALAALDQARAAFDKASSHVGAPVFAEIKARGKRAAANLKAQVAERERAVAVLVARAAAAAGEAEDLRRRLAAAPGRPLRLPRDLIAYRYLGFLPRHRFGVSARTAARWAERRRKRDADRSAGVP